MSSAISESTSRFRNVEVNYETKETQNLDFITCMCSTRLDKGGLDCAVRFNASE